MNIFDSDLYQKRLINAQKKLDGYDFLLKRAANSIVEHITDINRQFENIIELGYRTYHIYEKLKTENNTYIKASIIPSNKADIIYAPEHLPLDQYKGTCDLVICNLHAHHINDVPGFLIQAKHLLKPDGMFIASLFGVETLKELRESLQNVEANHYGQISPRLSPLVDIRDAGGLLQRAGFALPVIDKEMLTVSYKDSHDLMLDLRGMGETNIMLSQNKQTPPKGFFDHLQHYYKTHFTNTDGMVDATVEILYLTGWSPSPSQQKPLKPGSAEHSLTQALSKDL